MFGAIFAVLKPFLTVTLAEKAVTSLVDVVVKSNKNPYDDELAAKIAICFKECREAYEAGKAVVEELRNND